MSFTSTSLKPDEGHLHALLDGRLISMTLGLEQEVPNVAAGAHTIRVGFVAADHAPRSRTAFRIFTAREGAARREAEVPASA